MDCLIIGGLIVFFVIIMPMALYIISERKPLVENDCCGEPDCGHRFAGHSGFSGNIYL